MTTELVAEVGSNFGGDLVKAKEYIRAAAEAGADAVKFQTLTRETLVAPYLFTPEGRIDNPVYAAFRNIGLPEAWHRVLMEECAAQGVTFITTPFNLGVVDLLRELGVTIVKIASGDITFLPLLREVGSLGVRVVLSTGASELGEVQRAVEVLRHSGARDIVLLHCVARYPPDWDEMNLRVIPAMSGALGLPVGVSDHTPGDVVPIAAVSLGAVLVEKHVTFDRNLEGPDHSFAMTFDEFAAMADKVRKVEAALGTDEKRPTQVEYERRHRIRRTRYDPVTFDLSNSDDAIWLRPEQARIGEGNTR